MRPLSELLLALVTGEPLTREEGRWLAALVAVAVALLLRRVATQADYNRARMGDALYCGAVIGALGVCLAALLRP